MGECEVDGCDGDKNLKNSCSYCEMTLCSKHRLPESHNCPSLIQTANGPKMNVGGVLGESQKQRKKQCANCSNYVPADKDLCLTCRRSAKISEEVKSPKVTLKDDKEKQPSRDGNKWSKRLSAAKIRVETIWIRLRAWIATGVQLASIAVFLTGVWTIVQAYTTLAPVTLFGVQIPAIIESPRVTLLIGGVVIMIIGLALSLKTIVGSTTPQMH